MVARLVKRFLHWSLRIMLAMEFGTVGNQRLLGMFALVCIHELPDSVLVQVFLAPCGVVLCSSQNRRERHFGKASPVTLARLEILFADVH